MPVGLDIVQQSAVALLPFGGEGIPYPAVQLLESVFAIGVKGAFGVVDALISSPPAERVAIDIVGIRYAGMPVGLDIVQQSAVALLPLDGVGIPCPAVQFLEPVFAIGVKGAFGVAIALHADP